MNNIKKRIKTLLNEAFDQDIETIHSRLVVMSRQWGGKSYLVGGAVRDELMGIEPKDMDYVITRVELEDLAKALEDTFVDMGAKIAEIENNVGIVKLVINDEDYEFAVPRIDKDRQTVEKSPNLPVEKDLERRDFTINAIAKDLETGDLVQPEGQDGFADIKNKVIRAVGDPNKRFDEDPLRMLRAIQFSTRLDFDIEDNTWDAIVINKDDFKKLSDERFKQEFVKAWTKGSKNTEKFFTLLSDSGVGPLLFGSDFKPIPVDIKDLNAEDGFHVQFIAAFLNGGNSDVVSKKNFDRDLVRVSRWFKDAIENDLEVESIKHIRNNADIFPIIRLAFSKIDSKLLDGFNELISKPIMDKRSSDSWNIWELPIMGGEIIEASGGKLKGKAISQATLKLIQAYQNGSIEIDVNDEEKSKEIAKQYINDVILKDLGISESIRLNSLEERINKILYK